MRNRYTDVFLAVGIAFFYWIISRLWRVRHVDKPRRTPAKSPQIYAHWHGDELLLVGAYTYRRMAILSSRSRDGLLMARVLRLLGYRVARGSSSKGGAAGLKGLIDLVIRRGYDASLAVDGPRGPQHRVKPGILKLAQKTGLEIIPGAAAASRRHVFEKAWNKCYVPLPFSRCVIVYGKPISVPSDANPDRIEAIRCELEQELLKLKARAEASFERNFAIPESPQKIFNGV